MNKLMIAALSIASVCVWTGIARADDVLVCGAPRLLDAGTVGSHVQECKVIHVAHVREPKSFVFGARGGK